MQNFSYSPILPPSIEFSCVACQISNIKTEMMVPSFTGSEFPLWIVASISFIRKDNKNTIVHKIRGDRVSELIEVLDPSIWSSRHPKQEFQKLLGKWCVICIDGDNELLGTFGYEDFGLLLESTENGKIPMV